jgi:hypothetical protein
MALDKALQSGDPEMIDVVLKSLIASMVRLLLQKLNETGCQLVRTRVLTPQHVLQHVNSPVTSSGQSW